MDCDFEEKTAYVYSLNDRLKTNGSWSPGKLGVPGEFTDRLPSPSLWPEQFDIQTGPVSSAEMDRRDFKEPAHLRAHAGAGAGRNNCNYGLWKSHGKQNNCSHPFFPF